MHDIQVSHGILLPAKLYYLSWEDCVGNNMLNEELTTCDVSMLQTLLYDLFNLDCIHLKKAKTKNKSSVVNVLNGNTEEPLQSHIS